MLIVVFLVLYRSCLWYEIVNNIIKVYVDINKLYVIIIILYFNLVNLYVDIIRLYVNNLFFMWI